MPSASCSARKLIRDLTDTAILPLVLIPLAFGYSVVRYRLMDVELVVRRVFVYVLTTLAIALMVGAVVYLAGLYALGGDQGLTSGEITFSVVIAVVAMAAIVMIAAPVKSFLQERIDRHVLWRALRHAQQLAGFWPHAFCNHRFGSAA